MTDPADRETTETTDTTENDESTEARDGSTDRSRQARTRSRTRRGARGRQQRERGDAPDGGPEEPTSGPGDGGGRRGRDEGAAAEPAATADAGSDPASATASADRGSDERGAGSSEGGGGGRARRRRGRRGRGGRGRGGASGSQADGGDTSGDAHGEASKDRGGSGGGQRSGSSPRDGDEAPTGPRSEASDDDPDHEVRAAMAKGGTRSAAKRGGNRSGNRSGNKRSQRPGGVPEEVRRAILEGPPRTMLVTSLEDRTQIAVLEDRTVVEHYVTRTDDVTLVGNIYMARVQNVLPGMEAAFLDIGKGRNGVLYAGEVLYDELDLEEGAAERIENVLKPGQQVLVQVTKDPMGNKGPRLTMHLSLAGRFMVLAPNSDLFGISRKLTDKERDRLRRIVKSVKPSHHGVIVRTAAEGATEEQITADLERLLAKWERVEERVGDAKALTPVYEEPPLVVKVIRDNFGPEFECCIVDDEGLYHQVREYLTEVAPELLDKVELYGAPTSDARSRAAGAPASEAVADDPGDAAPAAGAGRATSDDGATTVAEGETGDTATSPGGTAAPGPAPATGDQRAAHLAAAAERRAQLPRLFDAYDVTEQLRKAMGRKVWLPSGGHLIIETTEAMKVIDVNTGKFTGGADTNLEEVVLKTNLEAADEIVRQLRLRDIGGIIIIDFIDMLLKANQEQVVRRLKRELLRDRTKTRVSDVSQLGLVQMTRKNVSQGLLESFSTPCEVCGGRGVVSELD